MSHTSEMNEPVTRLELIAALEAIGQVVAMAKDTRLQGKPEKLLSSIEQLRPREGMRIGFADAWDVAVKAIMDGVEVYQLSPVTG